MLKALRSVNVTRYVTPLREGDSMPAIAEEDDGFLYVIKFRGAGQGPRALIAELVGGEKAVPGSFAPKSTCNDTTQIPAKAGISLFHPSDCHSSEGWNLLNS